MVVQQDFEKGRSQRLWFRRYDRYKTSHFFQGLTLGAEGGGGLYAVLYGMYVCMYVCMDVCMYGCMDVWMYGCMDVWMYGCMDVCNACTCMYMYIIFHA